MRLIILFSAALTAACTANNPLIVRDASSSQPSAVVSKGDQASRTTAENSAQSSISIPIGTWYDERSGLMWQVCPLGQKLVGGGCSGTIWEFSFSEVVREAVKDRFGGFSDWRIPTHDDFVKLKNNGISIYEKNRKKDYQVLFLDKSSKLPSCLWSSGTMVVTREVSLSVACFPYASGYRTARGKDDIFGAAAVNYYPTMLVRDGKENREWSNLVNNYGFRAK